MKKQGIVVEQERVTGEAAKEAPINELFQRLSSSEKGLSSGVSTRRIMSSPRSLLRGITSAQLCVTDISE